MALLREACIADGNGLTAESSLTLGQLIDSYEALYLRSNVRSWTYLAQLKREERDPREGDAFVFLWQDEDGQLAPFALATAGR
jgi:hypothetical protein